MFGKVQELVGRICGLYAAGAAGCLSCGEAAIDEVFSRCRKEARSRGYPFGLTRAEFLELVQKPCHYCGAERSNVTSLPTSHGSFKHNGVAMADGAKGYTKENLVPCCDACRGMKGSWTAAEFVEQARLIAGHYNAQHSEEIRKGRVSCVLCSLKHISTARVLLEEARNGYPAHYWHALGHLCEAESELLEDFAPLAAKVREERKRLERTPQFPLDFDSLVVLVSEATGYSVDAFLMGSSNGEKT